MKAKRILSLLALCLCFVMTLQFAACDPGSTGEEQTTADQTDIPTTQQQTQAPEESVEETTEEATAPPEESTPEQSTEQVTEEPTEDETEEGSQDTTEETTEEITDVSTEETTTAPEEQEPVASKPSIDFDKTVQISENGSGADVSAATGLSYKASGYSKVENGAFKINAGYKVELGDQFSDSFNRLTLCYVSSAPMKCTVTYKQGDQTIHDLFYLEAGEQTFCALVLGYLSGKQATELTSITFETCEGIDATFVLCDVKTEQYKVYADDVYYIRNEYYKLGVRLSWGGGICYLRDRKNKISGVENLINQADTGRLVQQSYYGTYANGEYKDGDYNGVRWPYNPVQGGDVHGNPSRIIDIVVGEESLYIKAQPQDWGHDGELTISYMENVYVLEENYVRVDNRFVDFSGWEHRYASQELPAFYTLSYFGEFTYYAGSKPWEDQPLTTVKNLNFWGDPEYSDDCRFPMRYSNTETWCAWTNAVNDYGIGIYVPNIDTLFAGRHAYNGSMDAYNGATNYVAPLCTMKLVSFKPIEYSYMITTGTIDQIRNTFKENKDFATNETLHENYISDRIEDEGVAVSMEQLIFDDQPTTLKLKPTNNSTVGFSQEQQAAILTIATASDPHVTIDYTQSEPKLKAEDYSIIKITYMIPTTNQYRSYIAELFLSTGTSMGAEGGKSVRTQLVADGEYHTVEIKVSGLGFWSGNINAVRFDFFDACAEGDVLYVQSIELTN